MVEPTKFLELLSRLPKAHWTDVLAWAVAGVSIGFALYDRHRRIVKERKRNDAERSRAVGNAEAKLREDLLAELQVMRGERMQLQREVGELRIAFTEERARRIELEHEVKRLREILDSLPKGSRDKK